MGGVELCVVKGIASGLLTSSIPATAEGKNSDVRHIKRKIVTGLPSVRKKVRNSCDIGSVQFSKSAANSSKRKVRVEKDNDDDTALELDAAKALTEFYLLARSSHKKLLAVSESVPQWSRKKRRSSRVRAASSKNGSTDSFAENPTLSQLSQSATSGLQAFITVPAAVKLEDNSGFDYQRSLDIERQHKLLSDSSNGSTQLDSRAESPSSPLPTLTPPGTTCIIPKFEESFGVRSAFYRVVPVRPAKKPTVCRKLKVIESIPDVAKTLQASVEPVARKKPRPNNAVQTPAVKLEEPEAVTVLPASGFIKNNVTDQVPKCASEVDAFCETQVEVKPVLAKLEGRQLPKTGQQRTGKPKPVISESEKEARRQRRVQANRESARQTIRRKQVLCEQLTQKAQHLAVENDSMKQEIEQLAQDYKKLTEANLRLKEQLLPPTGSRDTGPASTPVAAEKLPSVATPFSIPMVYTAVPPQIMWTMSLSQAAPVAGAQPGEMIRGPDLSSAMASTYGNSMGHPFWMGTNGIVPAANQLPHFFPSPFPSPVASQHIKSAAAEPVIDLSPSKGTSAPTSVTETPPSSGKVLAVRKAVNFDSFYTQADGKKFGDQINRGYPAHAFHSQSKYITIGPPFQLGTNTPLKIASQKSADDIRFSSMAGSHIPNRALGTLNPHAPKIMSSRYPMFGNGRRYPELSSLFTAKSSGAAAAAEARRRRKELTRSKSLPHRQAARLAASAAVMLEHPSS